MIWFTFHVAVCLDSIASTISFIDANRKTVKHKSLRQKGRMERLENCCKNISELLGFCRNVSEQYVLTCDAWRHSITQWRSGAINCFFRDVGNNCWGSIQSSCQPTTRGEHSTEARRKNSVEPPLLWRHRFPFHSPSKVRFFPTTNWELNHTLKPWTLVLYNAGTQPAVQLHLTSLPVLWPVVSGVTNCTHIPFKPFHALPQILLININILWQLDKTNNFVVTK